MMSGISPDLLSLLPDEAKPTVFSFYVYTKHADILACETKCSVELARVSAHVGPQSRSHMWTRQKMLGHLIKKSKLLKNYDALVRKAPVSDISLVLLNKIWKKVFGVWGVRPTNYLAV